MTNEMTATLTNVEYKKNRVEQTHFFGLVVVLHGIVCFYSTGVRPIQAHTGSVQRSHFTTRQYPYVMETKTLARSTLELTCFLTQQKQYSSDSWFIPGVLKRFWVKAPL